MRVRSRPGISDAGLSGEHVEGRRIFMFAIAVGYEAACRAGKALDRSTEAGVASEVSAGSG